MNDEPKMAEPVPYEFPEAEEKETDPAPELKIVPIEDLDKVEKLLDVALSTIQTPNLPNIKAACMQELKEIDDAMGEAMLEAQEAYDAELAEWSGRRQKEAEELRKKTEEENRKKLEAARERGEPDSIAGSPRDTLAYPSDPNYPGRVYPEAAPVAPKNGIERRI